MHAAMLVGLEDYADMKVETFSKGMRMRLNFVRAIQHDPELIFLDEPTAGLDPVNAGIVKSLIADRGTPVVPPPAGTLQLARRSDALIAAHEVPLYFSLSGSPDKPDTAQALLDGAFVMAVDSLTDGPGNRRLTIRPEVGWPEIDTLGNTK